MDIKRIVKTAFPDYRGRKIKLTTGTIPQRLDSYWDSGHRDYWAFVRLADMAVLDVHSNHPAFEPNQPRTLRELPAGFALVCRTYSGVNQYVRVWVSEAQPMRQPALPSSQVIATV